MTCLFTTALFALLFFGCGVSLADYPQAVEETESLRPETQGTDRESPMPSESSARKAADGGEGGKEVLEGNNAHLLPSLSGELRKKAKQAIQTLRDAFRRPVLPSSSDIPIVFNEPVDRHIRCFTGPKRDSFAQWLARARKYEPTVRAILKKNRLPEDLVYVAMIESGFNMKACSHANASGPWQFTDETGRQFGLRVNHWIDERYNLEKSTSAAARYLKKLFRQFGCWYLVAASYNAGENRVRKAMEDGRTKDFWEMRDQNTLPRETQEYVPQLIAATIIAKNPESYGFAGQRSARAAGKPTKIGVPGGVPLGDIAKTVSVDLADLKALNPEILQEVVPPYVKTYPINLPESREGRASPSKIKKGLRWDKRVVRVLQHRIRARDTAKTIERRYRVTSDDLLLVNAGGLDIQEGQLVYIPRFAGGNKSTRSPKKAKGQKASARGVAPAGAKSPSSLSSRHKAGPGAHAAQKRAVRRHTSGAQAIAD
jgi:hypothetical protein